MIDPRRAIAALFDNGRITATDDGLGDVQVGVQVREDNMAMIRLDDTVGMVILQPIPSQPVTTFAGGNTALEQANIMVDVWVEMTDGMTTPDKVMKQVLNAIQNMVMDHHTDVDADTCDLVVAGFLDVPSDSPKLLRKAVMLTACGYKIRP